MIPALYLKLLLFSVLVHSITNVGGIREEGGGWRHTQLAYWVGVVNGGGRTKTFPRGGFQFSIFNFSISVFLLLILDWHF